MKSQLNKNCFLSADAIIIIFTHLKPIGFSARVVDLWNNLPDKFKNRSVQQAKLLQRNTKISAMTIRRMSH